MVRHPPTDDDGSTDPYLTGPLPEPSGATDDDVRSAIESAEAITDGGRDERPDVLVVVYHDSERHEVPLSRFESGFAGLLVGTGAIHVRSDDADGDRIEALQAALLSPIEDPPEKIIADGGTYETVTTYVINDRDVTTDPAEAEAASLMGAPVTASTERRRVAPDGGTPSTVEISVASNYRDGGVWLMIPGVRRRLLSPDDARSFADSFEDRVAATDTPDPDGTSHELADSIRELADEVEAKCDDPNPDAFDTFGPDDRQSGDVSTGP